jgi:hypothetical protein
VGAGRLLKANQAVNGQLGWEHHWGSSGTPMEHRSNTNQNYLLIRKKD